MARIYYRALLEPDGRGGYGVVFPELPGCVSHGDDAADAVRMATEALAGHLGSMSEHGDPVPDPAPLDAPLPGWLDEGAEPDEAPAERLVRVLVPFEAPGRAVRLSVTIEEGLLERIDAAAAARGMSRSALLAEGARRLIGGG